MGIAILTVIVAALVSASSGPPLALLPGVTGPYAGQPAPGALPELFAPGIVASGLATRDIAMTPDGNEIYFCVVAGRYEVASIVATKRVGDGWTVPEVEPFSGLPTVIDLEPHVAPDGQRFFFMSNRPRPGKGHDDRNQDIWVMERVPNGWGEPHDLGAPVNTDMMEYFPSVTKDGTLYFGRGERGGENLIWRARLVDGHYQEPERLPPQVNAGRNRFNAFVAPDESFLILSIVGLPEARGASDYYICFRSAADRWSEPVSLGDAVNQPGSAGFSPFVSPDGKWFFFMSDRQLPSSGRTSPLTLSAWKTRHTSPGNGNSATWWMDASFLARLHPEPLTRR